MQKIYMFKETVKDVGTIYLDPLAVEHKEAIMLWINNMRANQYLSRTFPITGSIEESWIRSIESSENEFVFSILFASEENKEELIGTCGIHNVDWISRNAETGIAIGDERFWSKGIGTIAKRIIMKYAFENLNLERLSVKVIDFNERSLALQKRAGFKEEGRLRRMFYKNGEYYDEVIFGMLREEYLALKK